MCFDRSMWIVGADILINLAEDYKSYEQDFMHTLAWNQHPFSVTQALVFDAPESGSLSLD